MAPRDESFLQQADPPGVLKRDPMAVKDKLRMDVLKRIIPDECFHKSLVKSLFYMVRDMGLICALWKAYPVYVEGNWPLTFVWWNAMGFMMWALFVVGHDCGHTTFSEYTWVNAVCGHLCHAPLLVPFWPWAQSHHQHHSYHNHVEKDHSFPWFRKEQYATQLSGVGRTILKTPLHPLFSYGVSYLFFGYWDGSHFNPFGSLFKNRTQRVQCAVSSLAVALFLGLFLHYVIEYSWSAFAVKYAAPWCIYNYWLVMVTYLQHHEPDSITYDDADYSFAVAAMETVDRKYCWGVDDLHHNITDGHVVHHLFFTKIPHYNLMKATDALRPYLEGLGVYRYQRNPLFLWTFVQYNYKYGLFTHSKADEPWAPPQEVKKVA
ncbi:fatty acid desaturase [Tribonema minus]|uniref:Fatty acid desaturase n=1 Tax=Tribonema minus TaxID=303371 RepID=A0A835YPJ0_9STRA|nr:fatty acid desaturase [Tribonema minus]